MRTVADGQVEASAAAIYTAVGESTVNISLLNTSGSLTETIVVTVLRPGSTARRVARFVLAPNEQGFIQGLGLSDGDIVKASSSDATTTDYIVMRCTTDMPFLCSTTDQNGQSKTNSAATAGLPLVKYATGTTTTTFTAAQMTGGQLTVYTSTAVTPGSIATPTATALFAAIAGAYVGQSWIFRVINDAADNSLTVTAGSGVTLSGKTTHVATPFGTLDYLITFTSASAATMVYINGGQSTTV